MKSEEFSVDIYLVFRLLNSIDPILAVLDASKLTRSCKVIAAHTKDTNVREGQKKVRIPNPHPGSPSHQENTESQKKDGPSLSLVGSTHRQWSPLTSLGNWWSVIDVGRSSKRQRLPASINYYPLATDVSKSQVVKHLCLEWAQVPTF